MTWPSQRALSEYLWWRDVILAGSVPLGPVWKEELPTSRTASPWRRGTRQSVPKMKQTSIKRKKKTEIKTCGLLCRGAGTGGLGLTIEGASEAKISCKDNKDGSCSVEYIPFTPGDYDVNITYGGQPIPGSPFRVPVKDPVDPSKVKCSGPGLGTGVRAHVPQTFTVDCTQAGQAPLDVKLYGPTGEKIEPSSPKTKTCPTTCWEITGSVLKLK